MYRVDHRWVSIERNLKNGRISIQRNWISSKSIGKCVDLVLFCLLNKKSTHFPILIRYRNSSIKIKVANYISFINNKFRYVYCIIFNTNRPNTTPVQTQVLPLFFLSPECQHSLENRNVITCTTLWHCEVYFNVSNGDEVTSVTYLETDIIDKMGCDRACNTK